MLGNSVLRHRAKSEWMFSRQEPADEIPRANFFAIDEHALAPPVPDRGEMVPFVARDHADFGAMDNGFIRRYAVSKIKSHVTILADAERKTFRGILVLLADDTLQLR